MLTDKHKYRVGILHGAGYAARDLMRLVAGHPALELSAVASDSHAGEPFAAAHPGLRGVVDGTFASSAGLDAGELDVILSCGRHGPFLDEIAALDSGFDGIVVDLSANFRLRNPADYQAFYGFDHDLPDLLARFVYGLTERRRDELRGARRIANPGCFATGVALSLAPIAERHEGLVAQVVAMTGASGAGTTARPTTHFPERDGNARAYDVWRHRHTPEILQEMPHPVELSFVPSAGPWVYGIWGVAHVIGLPDDADIDAIYRGAYGDCSLVRLIPDALPELKDAARTPFVDIGWMKRRDGLVLIGFALDNLIKGAAGAAVQNVNVALGLPEAAGLLPGTAVRVEQH